MVFEKEKYTEEIFSLINGKTLHNELLKNDIGNIIDKITRDASLLTFENNMHLFPIEDSFVRRI